jgi:hypothetical protein
VHCHNTAAEIVVSNPTTGMDVGFCECSVFPGLTKKYADVVEAKGFWTSYYRRQSLTRTKVVRFGKPDWLNTEIYRLQELNQRSLFPKV